MQISCRDYRGAHRSHRRGFFTHYPVATDVERDGGNERQRHC